MTWWMFLLAFILGFLFLMSLGMPVAFAFFIVNLVASLGLMGIRGPGHMVNSIYDSLSTFTLAPVPFFILMGEIFLHSGIISRVMKSLEMWFGRIPARQSLLAAGGGTLFSTLSGNTMANTAMLGGLLVPEMRQKGYSTMMSVGPILGVGGLAMIIPPSSLAVLLGSVAQISIGGLLIGGIIPGLIIALLYVTYIMGWALLFPEETPADDDFQSTALSEKLYSLVFDVFPLFTIVFVVIGFIVLGIATPTESAALGALATLLITIYYRRFTFEMVKQALAGTLEISGMVFLIVAGSITFSRVLGFSGASRELVDVVQGMGLSPVMILIVIQLLTILLGTFMDQASMIMLIAPMAMPIVESAGINPIWFGIVFLLSMEIGLTSPPFGLMNFVMKGAVEELTMVEIWKAAVPFIVCDLIAMAIFLSFPGLVVWLPGIL